MQCDGLIVCNVAPAFAFAGDELWIETPRHDGIDDGVIGAVEVVFLGDGEELSVAVA